MKAALLFLGAAYGAVLLWLIVRAVKRPKQWEGEAVAVLVLLAPLIAVLFGPYFDDGRGPKPRSQCRFNLMQIGLALQNYAAMHGTLPPACTSDAEGRRMHSWRVLILPFLDQIPLYNRYRFDEPWDGPNNRNLADAILDVYNCPSDDHGGSGTASTMTNYVAVLGPETAWPETKGMAIGDIRDGPNRTILVAEVANSGIHWMEPRDMHVTQMAPTVNATSGQGISSRHTGGAHILTAEGRVLFINQNVSGDDLRAWLTAHAGDAAKEF